MKKRAPAPTQSLSIEREYYRHIRLYRAEYAKLVKLGLKDLLPRLRAEVARETPGAILEKHQPRMDVDAAKSVSELFDAILMKLEKRFPDAVLRRWALAMVSRTHKTSAKNQAKHLARATAKRKEGPVEVLGILDNQRKLRPYFENVVDKNVALIRSIPERQVPTFKNALVDAITRDLTVRDIAKIVEKKLGVTENSARFIARDQVGKLNGELDKYHQQLLGLKKFTWRTMGDGSVRGNPSGLYPKAKHNHWKLDGEQFTWARGAKMKDGAYIFPKSDPGCRCYAEAVLDELLDD